MYDPEGSEYDRLFYPFLFEGGKASIEDVLAQVRHSTLEKCREVIALRRATLERSGGQIVAAGQAMALPCWLLATGAAPRMRKTWWLSSSARLSLIGRLCQPSRSPMTLQWSQLWETTLASTMFMLAR